MEGKLIIIGGILVVFIACAICAMIGAYEVNEDDENF